MNEEKKSGWSLTSVFSVAAITAFVVTTIENIGWQLVLDPIFFPIVHGMGNATSLAWIAMMQDWFNWIPYHLGLMGDGGLLKPVTDMAVSGYAGATSVPTLTNFAKAAVPFSMDGL